VPTLATLAWLAGCWQSALDEPGSGEQWMAPAGGSMLGMARTVKAGRMVQFEFMQLRETAAGVSLLAQPGGRQTSVFMAKQVSADAAVFERAPVVRSTQPPVNVGPLLGEPQRVSARPDAREETDMAETTPCLPPVDHFWYPSLYQPPPFNAKCPPATHRRTSDTAHFGHFAG
jgi:hypothetical protein